MIVEFLEGQDFMVAWVLTPALHRLGVLSMNGREMNVSQSRILSATDLPDPNSRPGRLELLRAVDASRRLMAEEIDLNELWDILEGEGEEFSFETLASLFFGRNSGIEEKSALTRAVFNDGLKFKFLPTGAVRHTVEEVAKMVAERDKQAQEEEIMAAWGQWLINLKEGRVAPEPPEDEVAREELLDFALWGEKAAKRPEAKKILERASLSQTEDGAFQALTLTGDFTKHENMDLRRLGVPLSFSPETGEELAALKAKGHIRRSERLDLTALSTLTIDSNGARDLDDAVSIKSLAGGCWQVGIHITDVASLIPQNSFLDLEARSRASSIYLPEGKYPMFPPELSEGILSLTRGDMKPACSFMVTLDSDGQVSGYTVESTLIRVDRQFSFSEADQIQAEDSELVDLWDLSQALLSRRKELGGNNLDIPKLNIYFQPDGTLATGLTQWSTPSKVIIGELMILANYLAADYLHKNGYACPYRYQEKPRAKNTEELSATVDDIPEADVELAQALAARRRTGRSGLSFVPAAHHGLGLPVYTAFTAPMRRYLDLLVARQVSSLAQGGPPAMDEQEFLRLAIPAHELGRSINKMQGLRQRYWLKTTLGDKLGQVFSALVFEQRDRRLRVCVMDYMLEIDLYLPRSEISQTPSWFGRRLNVKLVGVPQGDENPRFELAP